VSNDIVTRLREIPCNAFARVRIEDAAAEIERLRTQLEMWQDGNIMAESHRDEIELLRSTVTDCRIKIERLTAERDVARREVCNLRPSVCLGAQTAVEFANHRGWDCFKEDGK